MPSTYERVKAFTLIELSIVLVVIGLLAGGILVGRDLIAASAIRAQISQIQRYQQAVNAFKGKFGYLPGDIPDPVASQYGFSPRNSSYGNGGQGDGNAILLGCCQGPYCSGIYEGCGENVMFWVDLSVAGLIGERFNTATTGTNPGDISSTMIGLYFPAARIGSENSVYVYSGGWFASSILDNQNYFGLAALTGITSGWSLNSKPGLTVRQAYEIDKKLDDGNPLNGKANITFVFGGGVCWPSRLLKYRFSTLVKALSRGASPLGGP